MPRSSTSTSEASRDAAAPVTPEVAPVTPEVGPSGARRFVAWLAGVLLVLVAAPLAIVLAFMAHEPNCPEAEAFWLGDLPTGPGRVEGVVLGSSQMGLDVDVHALAGATGHPWVRVARHAVEHASIPRSYPRMLASSPAAPGLSHLVVEVSPLLFDEVGCARKELDGVPMRPQWWGMARASLGPDAELAPQVAMGWLPHRWIMTAGRRRDLVTHAKNPGEALALLRDLPRVASGFTPPARWEGEPVPDLTPERIEKRRRFLFGAPLDRYVPEPSASCLATVRTMIETARPERAVLVIPPVRGVMRDAIPADYRAKLRAEVDRLAATDPERIVVLDATDAFGDREAVAFTDFDHLSAAGAKDFTAMLAEVLR